VLVLIMKPLPVFFLYKLRAATVAVFYQLFFNR